MCEYDCVDSIDGVESGSTTKSDEDFPSCENVVSFDLDTRSCECFLCLLVTDDLGSDEDWSVEYNTGKSESSPCSEQSQSIQHQEETAPSRSSNTFDLRTIHGSMIWG